MKRRKKTPKTRKKPNRPKKNTPRKGRRRPSPAWREFEQLVARIEKCVSPGGAIVVSPDRITSNIRGKKREVDASVRSRVGSTDVLITIECRKRRPKQDVLWIEQLATKKNALGAAHTIAVSPAGFSEEARATAERYGIHLRRLSDVSPEEIRSWSQPDSLIHLYRHMGQSQIDMRFYAEADDSPSTEVLPEVAEAYRRDNPNARVFVLEPGGHSVSLNDIWLQAQAHHNFFAGIPPDGTPARRAIGLRFEKGNVGVMTTAGLRYVREIRITTDLSIRREEVRLDQAKIVEYTAPEGGQPIYRIEFTTSAASRLNVRVGLQGSPGSNQAVVSVEPLLKPSDSEES